MRTVARRKSHSATIIDRGQKGGTTGNPETEEKEKNNKYGHKVLNQNGRQSGRKFRPGKNQKKYRERST